MGQRNVRVIAGVVAAAGFLVLGALGGSAYTARRHGETAARAAAPTPARDSGAASTGAGHGAHGAGAVVASPPSEEPIEVTLTSEAVERAGIKTASVTSRPASAALAVPGTVTSNAYRDTKVNALVGGIAREVGAELGAVVRRGQPLAVIFSSELADAQMKYLSMRALLHADEQKFSRTRRLVDLGAASRQELDDATASRTTRETEVAAARQRLILLGLGKEQVERLTDASQIVSEVTVVAPGDGVVIARAANPGQVVAAGQELFTVTDLATLWVIGDVYEKDFSVVRVGAPATVRVPAAPGQAIQGRVTYIDPRVDPATRTAKVRVEVPNRDGALRLGMFVDVTFGSTAGAPRTVVPRVAVQTLGSRAVVYVATEDEGRFVERPVLVGAGVGDAVELIDGGKPGERVATEGSVYLRAEAGRGRAR